MKIDPAPSGDVHDLLTRDGLPEQYRHSVLMLPRSRWPHITLDPLAQQWLDFHDWYRSLHKALIDSGKIWADHRTDKLVYCQTALPRVAHLLELLDLHHRIESQHYFPRLARSNPDMKGAFDLLERDHEAIHSILVEIHGRGATLARKANAKEETGPEIRLLVEAIERSERPLLRHLADEEDFIVPQLTLGQGDCSEPVGVRKMGVLVDGRWMADEALSMRGARLERAPSIFRNWVTSDGQPGPIGTGGFAAESGRYHLYIARACPWAQRTAIFRELKKLQSMIGLSVAHWRIEDNGWTFETGPGVVPDDVNNVSFLWELYAKADSHYSGRATLPVLWDKRRQTIVSNESADIIRMMNSAFDGIGAALEDYYPAAHQAEIDAVNADIYHMLNNGVYRAGFATTQEAYEEAVGEVFRMLDWLDQRLSKQRYLVGDVLTEADWRLFPTLVRFDLVYQYHFKCNLRSLTEYPALWSYTRELYQHPDVAATVDFDHIRRHYFTSHKSINPRGIVPVGPIRNFLEPGDRRLDATKADH